MSLPLFVIHEHLSFSDLCYSSSPLQQRLSETNRPQLGDIFYYIFITSFLSVITSWSWTCESLSIAPKQDVMSLQLHLS